MSVHPVYNDGVTCLPSWFEKCMYNLCGTMASQLPIVKNKYVIKTEIPLKIIFISVMFEEQPYF